MWEPEHTWTANGRKWCSAKCSRCGSKKDMMYQSLKCTRCYVCKPKLTRAQQLERKRRYNARTYVPKERAKSYNIKPDTVDRIEVVLVHRPMTSDEIKLIETFKSTHPANTIPVNLKAIEELKRGKEPSDVAEQLNISKRRVCQIKCQAGLDGLIGPTDENADMTFAEIAVALQISERYVRRLYKSGIDKVMKLIEEIGDIELLDDERDYVGAPLKGATNY